MMLRDSERVIRTLSTGQERLTLMDTKPHSSKCINSVRQNEFISLLNEAASLAEKDSLKSMEAVSLPTKVYSVKSSSAEDVLSRYLITRLSGKLSAAETADKPTGGFISIASTGGSCTFPPPYTALPMTVEYRRLMLKRINGIINGDVPIEGKDIVFLYFCVYALNVSLRDEDSHTDARASFADEARYTLNKCGFSSDGTVSAMMDTAIASIKSPDPFELLETLITAVLSNPVPSRTEINGNNDC